MNLVSCTCRLVMCCKEGLGSTCHAHINTIIQWLTLLWKSVRYLYIFLLIEDKPLCISLFVDLGFSLKWAHPKICTTSPIFPWFSKWQGESGARQLGPRTTRTETSRPVSEDKSARKRGLVGPYVKTTRTINNYCCLTYFFNQIDGNHKDTVWHLSTVLGNVKKKSQYNQPKPYFFQKIIVKSFLDRFLQILHQNIRNCLYFDWLFTHYVVMSDFYLYIIFVFPVCV